MRARLMVHARHHRARACPTPPTPKRMALRWAAALALLGACGAAQVHYEIMPPVEYHVALETAGDRPVIVAFLDETLKEHKEELGVFNAAAAEFGCLTTVRTKDDVFKHVNEGGTFVMRAGVDSIARSIVDDTKVTTPRPARRAAASSHRPPARAQLELPAAVIFRKAGAPAEYYDGEEWDAASLRNWAYKAVTGAAIVATADELRDGALAELQAVGFVGELCGPEAVEFTTALMKHARLGRPLPSLITTNHKLGEYAGVHDCLGVNGTVLDAGYGVAVLGRCVADRYPAFVRAHHHSPCHPPSQPRRRRRLGLPDGASRVHDRRARAVARRAARQAGGRRAAARAAEGAADAAAAAEAGGGGGRGRRRGRGELGVDGALAAGGGAQEGGARARRREEAAVADGAAARRAAVRRVDQALLGRRVRREARAAGARRFGRRRAAARRRGARRDPRRARARRGGGVQGEGRALTGGRAIERLRHTIK